MDVVSFARKYGLATSDAELVIASKPDKCDICRDAADRICYDHDHGSGLHRGWLCDRCNRGIGLLRDDPAVLQRAIEYLT